MDSRNQRKDFGTRTNERIRVPKVFLINEEGNSLGEISTDTARERAKKAGLDLVEVSPNADPPVCRIMDYSKYLYDQRKKLKKNKSRKQKELKEFRFSPVIDIGDINTRVRRATDFLDKGHPVKITIRKKGRQSYNQMKEVFAEILTNFSEYSTIETEPKSTFNSISITFKKDGTSKDKQNSKKENKNVQPKGQEES